MAWRSRAGTGRPVAIAGYSGWTWIVCVRPQSGHQSALGPQLDANLCRSIRYEVPIAGSAERLALQNETPTEPRVVFSPGDKGAGAGSHEGLVRRQAGVIL